MQHQLQGYLVQPRKAPSQARRQLHHRDSHINTKLLFDSLLTCVDHDISFSELERDCHSVQVHCTTDRLRCLLSERCTDDPAQVAHASIWIKHTGPSKQQSIGNVARTACKARFTLAAGPQPGHRQLRSSTPALAKTAQLRRSKLHPSNSTKINGLRHHLRAA